MNHYTTSKLTLSKLLLVLFTSSLLNACLKDYSDPEIVALDYVDAVYAGSVKLFKEVVDEKDLRKTRDYQLFVDKKSSGKYSTKLRRDGIESIEVIKRSVGKTHASFKIKVIFRNKVQKTLNIRLHLSEDRWFVDPMTWGTW